MNILKSFQAMYQSGILYCTKYDLRDRPGRELAQGAPLWHTEYRTAYIDRSGVPNDRPGALAATSVSEYIRNPQFEAWSR